MLASGVRAELVSALLDRGAAVDSVATTADLRRTTERVLATPAGALTDALAEARFGPLQGARTAAMRARTELGARPRRRAIARDAVHPAPCGAVAALLDTVGTMRS